MKNEPTNHTQVSETGSGDPTALPLFAAAPTRPGRVRGTFTMTPDTTTTATPTRVEPVAPTTLNGHLNGSSHSRVNGSGAGLNGWPVPVGDRRWVEQGDIEWGLVAAFRTMVANRLTQALGAHWRARADTDPTAARRGQSGWTGWSRRRSAG